MMEYTLVRSRRKSIAVRICEDGTVQVRAPAHMPKYEIEAFLRSRREWIETHLEKINAARQESSLRGLLSASELQELRKQALPVFTEKVRCYAEKMGVSYQKISVRCQKTRWGSCSREGNLNFNCLLMLAPEFVQDYVVIHELCHRKQMNHSRYFWAEVAAYDPQWRTARTWLKENGTALMLRVGENK